MGREIEVPLRRFCSAELRGPCSLSAGLLLLAGFTCSTLSPEVAVWASQYANTAGNLSTMKIVLGTCDLIKSTKQHDFMEMTVGCVEGDLSAGMASGH